MKTKIEIKTIIGAVLFEYEKENNTIKKTFSHGYRNYLSVESMNTGDSPWMILKNPFEWRMIWAGMPIDNFIKEITSTGGLAKIVE